MPKTWKEIKEIFEKNGVKDEDEIDYIDITSLELDEDSFNRFDENSPWEIYS